MNAETLVSKLWNYCNVLRDDGLSYGDYVSPHALLCALEMERRLSVIYELETVATANHARATRLRQSVLQSAFSTCL